MFFEGLFSKPGGKDESSRRLRKYLERITIPSPDIKVVPKESDFTTHSYSFAIRGSVGPTVRRVHNLDEDGYPDGVLVQTFTPDMTEYRLDYTNVTFTRKGIYYQLDPYSFRISNGPINYQFNPNTTETITPEVGLFSFSGSFDRRPRGVSSRFDHFKYQNGDHSFELIPSWKEGQTDFSMRASASRELPDERVAGSFGSEYALFNGNASTKVDLSEARDGRKVLDWVLKQKLFDVSFIAMVSRMYAYRFPYYTDRVLEIINSPSKDWYRETHNLPIGISHIPEIS